MTVHILRWMALFAVISTIACEVRNDESSCTEPRLFGAPSSKSGLSASQCAPQCLNCGQEQFNAGQYTSDFIAWLGEQTLTTPPERLTSDPYQAPAGLDESTLDVVCVVSFEDDAQRYSLRTVESSELGASSLEFVTHRGACGLCSSLEDLSVYMGNPDLTEPVRACGARGFTDGEEAQFECLREIGFSEPCADIWLYNIQNTRQKCLAPCLEYLEEPHHLPDGSLNPCIQCDEDESGPVFKAVSGRTRRNSGLASGLCRPCASVYPLTHTYRFRATTLR